MHCGIYACVEGSRATQISNVVTVRCLGCNELYAKPLGGGTVRTNPGCPECGYVGWVSVSVRFGATPPRRSDEDPPLGRSAQSR